MLVFKKYEKEKNEKIVTKKRERGGREKERKNEKEKKE